MRNMRSIGIDLEPWIGKGLLQFHAIRSQQYGLEMHLTTFHKLMRELESDGRRHRPDRQPDPGRDAQGRNRDA